MSEKNEGDHGDALNRVRTAGSITITPELFEKLYLSPQNAVKGDLRLTFGNPTPYCLIGFLLSLTPLSNILMKWRGNRVSQLSVGTCDVGVYYFFGGLLMVVGSVGEWLLGNTFPCIVFGSFGAFWLQLGATLDPRLNLPSTYAQVYNLVNMPSTPLESSVYGQAIPGFAQSYAFFLLWMGVMCLIYLVCSLRTNVVFFGIFLTLVPAFGCLAAAFWYLAEGVDASLAGDNATYAARIDSTDNLIVAGGACAFVTCCLGWYIFTAIMLAAVDFPFDLPLGDLSTVIKGARDRRKGN